MSSLAHKKKGLELARVRLARQELEMKIEERLEEIQRLEEHIKIQIDTESKLAGELKQMIEEKGSN